MDKAHIGALGELRVAQYFLELGYEVFQNIAHTGPADLTVWDKETGQIWLVDVKSQKAAYVRKDGTILYGQKAILRDDGVYQVLYDNQTNQVLLPESWQTSQSSAPRTQTPSTTTSQAKTDTLRTTDSHQ